MPSAKLSTAMVGAEVVAVVSFAASVAAVGVASVDAAVAVVVVAASVASVDAVVVAASVVGSPLHRIHPARPKLTTSDGPSVSMRGACRTDGCR